MVGIACALGAALQAKFHRVAALILLGGAGLVTCVSFVWLSAPDLALTQIVVETVTTVLLLLGLRWLPKRVARISPSSAIGTIRWHRVRDFAIALLAGVGLAALALAAMQRPGSRQHFAVFRRERLHQGRRNQCGERHPRGFPRLRYARRDHGARGRCTDRLCVAAPLPSGARKHSRSRTAACAGRLRPRASRSPEGRHRKGHDGYCSADNGAAVSGDRRNGHLPALAGARPSGRRLRRWPHHGGCIHPAVHGSRHDLGGGAPARHAGALDGLWPSVGGRYRSRRLGFRTPVPDVILCLRRPTSASGAFRWPALSSSTSAYSRSSSERRY